MLNTDENALICDMAETYGIYDMGSLPLDTVAILAAGLGENSRIGRKISGAKVPLNTLLLAHIVDRLGLLVWQNTKDGKHNKNRPASFVEMINRGGEKESIKGLSFDTADEFWLARQTILNEVDTCRI